MTLIHVHGGVLLRVPRCWTCFAFHGRIYRFASRPHIVYLRHGATL